MDSTSCTSCTGYRAWSRTRMIEFASKRMFEMLPCSSDVFSHSQLSDLKWIPGWCDCWRNVLGHVWSVTACRSYVSAKPRIRCTILSNIKIILTRHSYQSPLHIQHRSSIDNIHTHIELEISSTISSLAIMAVIWGLDLRTMRWSAFKSSNMFGNKDYLLRRTKFIIYQCAMIFLVISESLGTAVLSDYLDQQSDLQSRFPGIDVFNNDYIGIASFNIFVGVFAATVFGAVFFFDLFFPARYEPRWVQNMWIGSAIFCCVAGLADALAYTVILALHDIKISDYNTSDPALIAALRDTKDKTPVSYRNSGRAVASAVFLWIGWICAVVR